jgi:hypothetical protein
MPHPREEPSAACVLPVVCCLLLAVYFCALVREAGPSGTSAISNMQHEDHDVSVYLSSISQEELQRGRPICLRQTNQCLPRCRFAANDVSGRAWSAHVEVAVDEAPRAEIAAAAVAKMSTQSLHITPVRSRMIVDSNSLPHFNVDSKQLCTVCCLLVASLLLAWT